MAEVLQASELTLNEVETKFRLTQVDGEPFFTEWRQSSPELTDLEKQNLDRVKADFLYLNKYPLFEEAVKMVVLSPLLTANFYQSPFRIREEVPVQIAIEDEGQVVRGRIDILVVQEQFWVLAIESKQASLSLKNGVSQALTYMAAAPNLDRAAFGLVTNGSHFIFLRLKQQNSLQYALSDEFSLYKRRNDLYDVLQILKQIGRAIA